MLIRTRHPHDHQRPCLFCVQGRRRQKSTSRHIRHSAGEPAHFATSQRPCHGTAQLAIDTATDKLTQRRTLPFGGTRGTEPTDWPGTKGFVGGTDDTRTTGLTHLGAREYDPSTGRFISVDPLLEIDKPQTLNGYTYAAQNPLAFSDPTGLGLACGGAGGAQEGCGTGVVTRADGSLSQNGRPTGGGTIYKRPTGPTLAGAETYGPVTVKPYGASITIQGVYIPTQEELAVTFSSYHENSSYQHNLENWGRSRCTGSGSDFCHTIGKLGWFGGDPEIDVLEVIGVRSYIKCYKGEGCTEAAADVVISAVSAGVGKGIKALAKVIKQGMKRGGSIPASCLVGVAHSFTAGTEVLMADGTTKPIEDVRIGDKVTVTDPVTGETAVREVTATIVTEDDKHFVDLAIATETGTATLKSTTTHPFWSDSEKRWMQAGQLELGMKIRTADGRAVPVTGAHATIERQRTYDLTIHDIHTYYVLAGETPVLVHNSNGCVNWASNSVKTWGHTFKTHGAGAKNTKALTDRARSTNNQQGQWLDNDAAAEFLKGLHIEGAGPRSVRIPDGLGQVIMPDGSIVQARAATIIPSPNGLYKTGFPIIGPN
ncbi:polymorphic toxin-type HINT domain-containing protein [Streptomyces sp. AVP053U2]|uniref:polymorphic toxin-type HINT domain-containing protein n=1 Tax=Streptomyces sp. AVP053U2 TaxID=1737066 RepID=UPI00073C8852|nr:polymorphic toxin-type HINT domain-containing protein [Streptomyces sp. AVP053U2]ODA69112.1 sugar-binding protein [Streptomyces sp. AVP053U2]